MSTDEWIDVTDRVEYFDVYATVWSDALEQAVYIRGVCRVTVDGEDVTDTCVEGSVRDRYVILNRLRDGKPYIGPDDRVATITRRGDVRIAIKRQAFETPAAASDA